MLILLILGVPIALLIWSVVKASNAERTASQAADAIQHLRVRLENIDRELLRLRQQVDAEPAEHSIEPAPAPAHKPVFVPPSPVARPAVSTPTTPLSSPKPVLPEPVITPQAPPPKLQPVPTPAFATPATPVLPCC